MLIVDAGPLFAAADRDDRHHEPCVRLLARAEPPLLVPALVVTEVAYLLADRLGSGAERSFADSLTAGDLLVEPVERGDWVRIAELLARYEDLGLGMVDASVVALAERLGATTIASLDHRHLGVVQPAHAPRLELVPAL